MPFQCWLAALGAAFTASAVDGCRALPCLTSVKLQLRAEQAMDAVSVLMRMSRLTSISLQLSLMHGIEGTPCAAVWRGLERLGPRLCHLDLALGVDGDGLEPGPLLYSELQGLTEVGELHLRLEAVLGPDTHARLPPLAGLPMLRRLAMRNVDVCVDWESCRQLTWLQFAGSSVSIGPTATLCFPKLRRLDIIDGCDVLDGTDLAKLLRAATALTRLVLHRITFAHNVLPALRGLKCVGEALHVPLVLFVLAARMQFPLFHSTIPAPLSYAAATHTFSALQAFAASGASGGACGRPGPPGPADSAHRAAPCRWFGVQACFMQLLGEGGPLSLNTVWSGPVILFHRLLGG
jgi:hypothetical protein